MIIVEAIMSCGTCGLFLNYSSENSAAIRLCTQVFVHLWAHFCSHDLIRRNVSGSKGRNIKKFHRYFQTALKKDSLLPTFIFCLFLLRW